MVRKRATKKDALAVTFLAYRRYGRDRFRVSPKTDNFAALVFARELGLIWFPDPTHGSVTADGIRALADFGIPQDGLENEA